MNSEKLLKNGCDMLYLSACAFYSIVPEAEIVEEMNLKEVYILSARHYMQAITYIALESFISHNPDFKDKISKELLYEWKFMKSKAIRSNILFEEQRNKLTAFLEENKIWYVFLKGIVLQNCYSNTTMRQMCDNDIFFDAARRNDLYDYFVGLKYEVLLFGKGCHDSYKKKPSLLFEMHHTLYGESTEEKLFNEYYKDVKDRLIKDENNNYGYHFSDEDFYIHATTHYYKHFINAGSGIRSLLDVYAYFKSKGEKLNLDYISEEFTKLGIKDFECDMRNLANKLFDEDTVRSYAFESVLNDEEMELFLFCLTAGTYGNKISYIKNKVKRGVGNKKHGVFKYILRRFFPDKSFYKMKYPKAYKYKVFIPFVAIYRIITRSIVNFKELKFEYKVLFKKK